MGQMEADLTQPSNAPSAAGFWHFSLSPLGDKTRLGDEWRRLEALSPTPFFLSWDWIGCWLDHVGAELQPQVLRAERDGRLAALALLTPRQRRWLGILPSRQLHLHETGDAALDSLTIEYNGILSDPAWREDVTARSIEWLLGSGRCDELSLSGLPAAALDAIDDSRFAVRLRDRKPTYSINLEQIRTAGGTFAATLSANTRAQLRRADRQFRALGDLRITAADTADAALGMLQDMIPLHQRYWQQRGQPGAFANPAFVSFHRQLIHAGFDRGCIQLLRCDAGSSVLGYLYNFVKDRRVYSYQSGFDYDLLPRSKPGWLCHHLAIEDNFRRGMRVYDLLAGDSQFKSSFADSAGELVWLTAERHGWKPSLLHRLRAAKHRAWKLARS